MAEAKKTYEGICELIVKEQYLNTCSKELAIFLKERKDLTVADLAKVAEHYLDAHPCKSSTYRDGKKQEENKKHDGEKNKAYKIDRPSRARFICGKTNHIAKTVIRGTR